MSYHKKRIQGDIRIIESQPLEGINICYDESNMLTWQFLIFGLKGTEYEGGEYIGKIVFDNKYPDTPPEFYMHTPNGRFDVDKKKYVYLILNFIKMNGKCHGQYMR